MSETVTFRDLRYVRVAVDGLAAPAAFARDTLGLEPAGSDNGRAYFRSDARGYSVCFTEVGDEDAIATRAPNGLVVEFVWRPLTSGWRYHGPRDAGIVELSSVSLACRDIAADEAFWTGAVGLAVSDWAGDAAFLRLDDAHHRIVLYPSGTDGLLGIDFAVEGMNNVMQNFYFLQGLQLPIVHGPGRQPTSGKKFVTTRGPRGLLFSYSTEMDRGAGLDGRVPRQFPAAPSSHCAWGSPTTQPEFLGDNL